MRVVSVRNKLRELYNSFDYDIIMITETWLNKCFSDSILDPRHLYTVIRYDRPRDTAGGGVCAFVHKSVRVAAVDCNHLFAHLEICSFDVYVSRCPIRFITVYRPSYEQAANLVDCLQTLIDVNQPCIIAGT